MLLTCLDMTRGEHLWAPTVRSCHPLLVRVCEGSSPRECRCTFSFLNYFWVGCSMPPNTRLGRNAANTGSFTPLCIIAPEGGEVPATVVVVQRRYPTQVWGEVPGLRGKCRSSRAHAAALQALESRTVQVRSACSVTALGMTMKRCSKSLQLLGRGARSDCPCGSCAPCQGAGVSLAGDLEAFKSLLQEVYSTKAKPCRRTHASRASWLAALRPAQEAATCLCRQAF